MRPGSERESRPFGIERLFQHGGDIKSAERAFPDAPRPWLDLSTGINPVPYPLPPLEPPVWTRLPEPAELQGLQEAASARYGAAPDRIVAAPGTQALIQWLPVLFPSRRVAILGPTYAEHERSWRASGASVVTVSALEPGDADAFVLVNPNNPDGRSLGRDEVLALADRMAARKGLLVVDEAFMDFGEDSIAADPPSSAIVLRSFGKAYGLAGVRLGFAVAEAERAARIRSALGPWPVSGAAIEIGRMALANTAWLREARARLQDDGAWLDAALAAAGFESAGAAPLFRLARHPEAQSRFLRLCAAGVLTRPFPAQKTLLRFGVPRREDRPRLAEALRPL